MKVNPLKGVRRFGKENKLSLRYIRSFEVIKRIGRLTYRSSMFDHISYIHNVFLCVSFKEMGIKFI